MVSRLSAFACQESRHQLRAVRQAGWAHGTGVARWMCEVHSDPERGVWKDISGAETGWDGWYSQLVNDLNDLKTPQNGDVS